MRLFIQEKILIVEKTHDKKKEVKPKTSGEKNVSTNTFRVLYSLGFSVLLKFEMGLNRGSIK